ncbi:hypothetical protein LCGC14_0619380 [marine sediment metagenome]|uniref:Uncharacterized protein n=1 Tax=marine sediment metagenome TaxID=412755 RepID=A0A0F9TRP2_9ZZZZ|nr:hypothetical protein [Actinomycetota bacterium]
MARKIKDNGNELKYKSGYTEVAFEEKDGFVMIHSAGCSMSFSHQQATHIGCWLQDAGYHIRQMMGIEQ